MNRNKIYTDIDVKINCVKDLLQVKIDEKTVEQHQTILINKFKENNAIHKIINSLIYKCKGDYGIHESMDSMIFNTFYGNHFYSFV